LNTRDILCWHVLTGWDSVDQCITDALPSVLWHCWLGIRKRIRPVKNWVLRYWCGYLSGARCRLFAYGPADATAIPKSHRLLPHLNPDWFYLSGTGLPRLPWKEAIKRLVFVTHHWCCSEAVAQPSSCPSQRRGHFQHNLSWTSDKLIMFWLHGLCWITSVILEWNKSSLNVTEVRLLPTRFAWYCMWDFDRMKRPAFNTAVQQHFFGCRGQIYNHSCQMSSRFYKPKLNKIGSFLMSYIQKMKMLPLINKWRHFGIPSSFAS